MNYYRKKSLLLLFILYNLLICSQFPVGVNANNGEPLTATFSSELLPGQNFTWVVKEWDQMDDWLNPGSNYIPMSGDRWSLTIIDELRDITSDYGNWDIMGWHIEPFDFPTFDTKFQFNISGHSFFDVFGDEEDDGKNWRMLNQLFLLPYTIKDSIGLKNFSVYYAEQFDNVQAEVDVDTSTGDLYLNATVYGEYVETHIEIDGQLGIREEFVYTKKPVGSNLISGSINLTLEESNFKPFDPGDDTVINTDLDDETETDTDTETDSDDDSKDGNLIDSIPSYPFILGVSLFSVISLIVYYYNRKLSKIIQTTQEV